MNCKNMTTTSSFFEFVMKISKNAIMQKRVDS